MFFSIKFLRSSKLQVQVNFTVIEPTRGLMEVNNTTVLGNIPATTLSSLHIRIDMHTYTQRERKKREKRIKDEITGYNIYSGKQPNTYF